VGSGSIRSLPVCVRDHDRRARSVEHAIKTAGAPNQMENVAAVRSAFRETRWVIWNAVRAVATTAAFSCLVWALVLNGRGTAG
jgi:hypothetical protein